MPDSPGDSINSTEGGVQSGVTVEIDAELAQLFVKLASSSVRVRRAVADILVASQRPPIGATAKKTKTAIQSTDSTALVAL